MDFNNLLQHHVWTCNTFNLFRALLILVVCLFMHTFLCTCARLCISRTLDLGKNKTTELEIKRSITNVTDLSVEMWQSIQRQSVVLKLYQIVTCVTHLCEAAAGVDHVMTKCWPVAVEQTNDDKQRRWCIQMWS